MLKSLPFRTAWPAAIAAFFVVTLAAAPALLAPTPVPLENLAAFKSPGANWQVAGGVSGDLRNQKVIGPVAGVGVLINNPTASAGSPLVTREEFGDLDLDLDFLLTADSGPGICLMGRYELLLRDSWKVKTPGANDCGAIAERWDEGRGQGHEGFEGAAPRANAGRAPGLWQHLHIEFRAPRFGADGKKTRNAQFQQVALNDFVVQENVELSGPTRAAVFAGEAPAGPVLIRGDRGAIAIRALTIKKFDAQGSGLQVEELAYKFYPLDPDLKGRYDSVPPKREGRLDTFSAEAVEKNEKYAAVFTGVIVVPRDGLYAFTAGARESIGLVVDTQSAIVPFDGGGQPVPVSLTAGRHPFRLDFVHSNPWARPHFTLSAEGPGLAPQLLTAEFPRDARAGPDKPRTLIIEPAADRIRLQRSFVPFDPKKRLYAINVGTPGGVNYSYDFETGALLRVWRGDFLDTFEMWDGRGENQLGKPAGPALTLNDKPVLALLERYVNDWPDQPDMMWSSQGYRLETDGQPTFRFKLSTLSATDRIAPAPDGSGLVRTLTVKGETTSWGSWVLLAEADRITPQEGGRGFVIGDRSYYLDLPADAPVKPLLRTRNGRQQLVVPIDGATLGHPITFSLVW
jgi:hypothetical protein